MANKEHLNLVRSGARSWNQWRATHPDIAPDLSRADLSEADLSRVNFRYVNLTGADLMDIDLTGADLRNADCSNAYLSFGDLSNANLSSANFSRADLSEADLGDANLSGTNLQGTDLSGANLHGADLSKADLSGANLEYTDLSEANCSAANLNGVNLSGAQLVKTDLSHATLTGCSIFGISAWAVKLDGSNQKDLLISPHGEAAIKVDNLEVAQFIYLLLNNQKIRDVINTIGQRAVLILGRFDPERKKILDALAEGLREKGFLPIIFDFERAKERDFTETIMTLVALSLFVIADITNPKSSPLELHATVPNYMIPFIPIIQEGEEPFSMFKDLQRYEWVLDLLIYDTKENLITGLEEAIIQPALFMHDRLLVKKAETLRTKHIREVLNNNAL